MKRLLLFLGLAVAQDTLGLSGGYTTLTTTNFAAQIVKNAQVLASLKPTGNSFDYSPNDVLSSRAANKQNHLGDITLRYRTVGGSTWTSASSADARAAVTAGTTGSNILASSNLKPTLPNGIPLDVTRSWTNVNGDLGLSFTIKNTGTSSIEIGALGFPIEFNSIFTNRNADQIQAKCSLIDPYIGNGAGYVQVTPVNGNNPALVVTGLNGTNFEGWRFLPETSALSYQSQVFEGFHEWLVYTKAWAENEWKSTTPWNAPTSRTVAAGESFTVGLRLSLGKGGVRDIETAVKAAGIPYATSVPGYIIPQDSKAKLFLDTSASVSSISFSPSGAFTSQQISGNNYYLTPSGSTWGRVRVTVAYSNGISQTLHYYITKSAPTAVNDLGNFLTNQQWFSDTSDPFDRAPSVITYDRETNKQVVQDDRVWIAGLSDEGGAGSFLAATMKQAIRPNAAEIKKLESFMTQTLWGTIQTTNYGVRKSVFYYGLSGFTYDSSLNWGSWTSWNKASAYATDRAYDYVHVTAAYWAFYRVARAYPSLVTQQTWSWYLNQAYQTIMFCTAGSVGYSDDGLMGETVWGSVLKDLQREGLTSQASQLEARMKTRAQRWDSLSVPYGSEMAWDSTGQEGVYYWTK